MQLLNQVCKKQQNNCLNDAQIMRHPYTCSVQNEAKN